MDNKSRGFMYYYVYVLVSGKLGGRIGAGSIKSLVNC